MAFDGVQVKIRVPAATFDGILNADCAQTENLYCLFEAVLESKMSTDNTDSQFWRNRQRNAGVRFSTKKKDSPTPRRSTNGFMIHAYRVLGPNKVHGHVALLSALRGTLPDPPPGSSTPGSRPGVQLLCPLPEPASHLGLRPSDR